jgi:hypothetical protein
MYVDHFCETFPSYSYLFLYSYVADLIKGLHKKHDNKLVSFFSITFRYIDDVLSLNSKFHDYVNRIHPIEIKEGKKCEPNVRKDYFNYTTRNPLFSSFHVGSNPLSMKS